MSWLRDCEEEYRALDRDVSGLEPSAWELVTDFYEWTIRDEIMHLLLVDEFGLRALREPETFADLVWQVRQDQASGVELSNRMRSEFGALDPVALLERWRTTYGDLLEALAQTDPERRIPWFGPDMAVSSFGIARQMEVWAHGQDIYDRLRIIRENTDHIFGICDLGVRTQGWSFRNRGLERPQPPRVSLVGPSRAVKVWNEAAEESIEGEAVDFALVVVQRRHIADTGLVVHGEGALQWMAIAQCFAGAPADGPLPGARNWKAQ